LGPEEGNFVTDASTSALTADDIQVTEHETLDRIATGTVTAVPFIGLGLVVWQTWAEALRWSDFAVFAIMYLATGLGVTVGFHRLLTHRSFQTRPWLRATFAAMGSMAIEGPVISWVADHRKHHAFSDQEGDPHSPHAGHEGGFRGALRGLLHAHVGWLFIHTQRANKERYAPDLMKDPQIRFVERTFLWWALGGLALPFVLGGLIGGSWHSAWTGLLWGGLIRVLLLHHVTYSINSLCHFFGRRRFDTGDESRNLAWLAPLSLGEAWHNNHHAFPTSAAHGMRRWEVDPSAAVIWTLEKTGLAWDVKRITRDRQARKILG
jgi:stearoyl-CoA desaturase (delta-9 desaturase)